MPLIVHPPSPPLNTYIDRLYYLHSFMPYLHEKIIPAPWLDLKVNFGDAIPVYKPNHAEPFIVCTQSWSVGLWNEYHIIDWPLDTRLFGVSFKPGGAYPFLQIPISELHNQVVSLDLIWGRFAAEIRERLNTMPTIQAGFALLEQLLRNRLSEAHHALHTVQYALGQIAKHQGALSIRALSEHIGISQNHLNTQFKQFVGGTPKEFARLSRFQRVVNGVDLTQPIDWTRVAHQSLYYDQSHFNKDFMAFTGHNPTTYLRLRRQVYREHPEHARYLRELPID
jgi:AraC-like DNA-binding protein